MLNIGEHLKVEFIYFGITALVIVYLFVKNRRLTTGLIDTKFQMSLMSKQLQEQVNAELSRRLASENIFSALFENSSEGILMLNENGRFMMCNKAGGTILGYNHSELIGRAMSEISPAIQPHLNRSSFEAIEEVFDDVLFDKQHRFEWCCLTKNKTEVMLEVVMFLLRRSGAKEIFMMCRDITELKRLQKEKEANQALLIQQTKLAELGSMIGVISHQWKQPINTISLLTQMLESDFEDGELDEKAIKEHIKSVNKQISFMVQTMDDFRDFYKPSKEKTSFSIIKVIASVVGLMEGQLLKDKIIVNLTGDETLLALGYSSEFKQVVLNILNNARDAFGSKSAKNRNISICVESVENTIELTIRDNAGGIPEAILYTVFDSFVSTKGDKGTGIGLSLAKTIVEKMNGKISVSNTVDGAEFKIILPLISK